MEIIIIIITMLVGAICTLIGIIYQTLSKRIQHVSKVHYKMIADVSAIKTNICWIKKKLDKIEI